MRAVLLRDLDAELEVLEGFEVRGPGPGEVRVRIAASGVCHSDLSLQNGTLPHPIPAVPGHEGAGEIIAVGEGVKGLAEGDHVIISWVPPCGLCGFCIAGQPHLCNAFLESSLTDPHFTVDGLAAFGFAGTGTFAEETVVPAEAAIPISPDVPFDVAALIGCGVMTGVGAALNTAQIAPGSSVVVFGCGGVGISAIQGARIAGAAEIVAVDVVEPKLDLARQFGATHACTPDQLGALSSELTGDVGFDYALEVVGTPQTIRAAWDATRRGGTTVVVGAGRLDAMVEFSAFELFYMSKTLKGCWYGSANVRTDFNKLLRFWHQGKLDLEGMITRRIDLSEINEAFTACAKGEVIRSLIEFK
jgi:S-(hydroxymethyl)glutathione dehydrogenase/alcohol dehydrogenase